MHNWNSHMTHYCLDRKNCYHRTRLISNLWYWMLDIYRFDVYYTSPHCCYWDTWQKSKRHENVKPESRGFAILRDITKRIRMSLLQGLWFGLRFASILWARVIRSLRYTTESITVSGIIAGYLAIISSSLGTILLFCQLTPIWLSIYLIRWRHCNVIRIIFNVDKYTLWFCTI